MCTAVSLTHTETGHKMWNKPTAKWNIFGPGKKKNNTISGKELSTNSQNSFRYWSFENEAELLIERTINTSECRVRVWVFVCSLIKQYSMCEVLVCGGGNGGEMLPKTWKEVILSLQASFVNYTNTKVVWIILSVLFDWWPWIKANFDGQLPLIKWNRMINDATMLLKSFWYSLNTEQATKNWIFSWNRSLEL